MVTDGQLIKPRMTPEPPLLHPPGEPLDQDRFAGSKRYGVWIVLMILVLVALLVVFYLPQIQITDRKDPATPAASLSQSASPPVTAAEDTPMRSQAETLLREFLHLRAGLELANAPIWGQPEWRQATTAIEQGDRLFLQNDFAAARAEYQQAMALLIDLEATRTERLSQALEEGQRALAEDDAKSAMASFEYALTIEPDHQLATLGVARAGVREKVLDLMQDGWEAEQQAELATAQAAYEQATLLDEAYVQASESVQRVSEQINQERFRIAMSDAIRALEAQQFMASAKALEIAAQLHPEDVSVLNLRQRLAAARERSTITALRNQAQAEVTAEDWQAASRSYAKVLVIDSKAAFAIAGSRLAKERIRLHQQFDHYLADPTRLYSDQPLANAERLLTAAGSAPADEPRLARKIATLRQQVNTARIPVTIDLRSDGLTDVVIYHVGHPGRFMQKQIELRPGTYTLVGSRPGYRDVRKLIEVKPDATPLVVSIRCQEMI